MNSSPTRVAAVTGGLLFAGALFGGIAGALAALIAVSITDGLPGAANVVVLGYPAIAGAVLGALLLPATSFLLLRRVPLGLSWIGTTVGTMIGGMLGWFAASAMHGNPVSWPVMAALAGFFLSVIVLRMRFSAPAERDRVRVPTGAGA